MTFTSVQSRKDLPSDPEALRAFSWDLVLAYHQLNEKYELLQRRYFGRSSERITASQQAELDAVQEEIAGLLEHLPAVEQSGQDSQQADLIEVTPHKRRRKHHGRNAIPEEMITDEVIDVPESQKVCECCGQQKSVIDTKSHLVVERVPAQYKATRYLRPVYACSHCKDSVALAEPPVVTPIAKGMAGPGLICFVLLSKYLYHLTLYRIQRLIFHESGIWFTRSTMVGWIKQCAESLQRIHRALLRAYRQSRIKHADETPLWVRYAELVGKSHEGRMWVGVGCEQRVAVFWYHENRTSKAALAFLKGSREGDYLMSDDCASYAEPVRAYKLQWQFCMMHARRKFHDAFKAGYKADFARKVLRKIRHIYRLERFASDKGFTVGQRGQLRREHTSKVMAELKAMLENPGFVLLPERLITKAINYLLSNWERAARFLKAGDLPLDNGVNERVLRALTIGRNNWLVAGSRKGAEWMAALYSIIATCKLNGIDPHEYLADVLMRIAVRPPEADISDLTPLGWLAAKNGGVLPKAVDLYPDEEH